MVGHRHGWRGREGEVVFISCLVTYWLRTDVWSCVSDCVSDTPRIWCFDPGLTSTWLDFDPRSSVRLCHTFWAFWQCQQHEFAILVFHHRNRLSAMTLSCSIIHPSLIEYIWINESNGNDNLDICHKSNQVFFYWSHQGKLKFSLTAIKHWPHY